MAYDYKPDVYNTVTDVKTLQQRIENNFIALLRCFSGSAIPNEYDQGTWWYDTANNIMKFRSSSGWSDVFDVNSNSVVLGPGSVGSTNISDSARKGTIVQDQNIAPSSCSLRATTILTTMPGMPSTDTEITTQFSAPGTKTLMSQKVFIPKDITRIYMQFRAKCYACQSAQIRFQVSGSYSGYQNIGGSYNWFQADVGISSGTSRWADIAVEANVTPQGNASVTHQGYAFRSNE